MSFEAVNWAWSQKGLTPHEKLTLLALANRHNPDTGCFPSLDRIAADVNCSRATIKRSIKVLGDMGLVRVEASVRGNGSQSSNRYHLAFEGDVVGVQAELGEGFTVNPLGGSERTPHKQVNNKQVRSKKDNLAISADDALFDEAWSAYPRKIGKGAARYAYAKAAKKISPEALNAAVVAYSMSAEGRDKKFLPHFSTWLNQERWTDEPEERHFSSMKTSDQMRHILGGFDFSKPMEIGHE